MQQNFKTKTQNNKILRILVYRRPDKDRQRTEETTGLVGGAAGSQD